jgi:hypothetical protein
VDAHPKTPLDAAYAPLFNQVIRAGYLNKPTFFPQVNKTSLLSSSTEPPINSISINIIIVINTINILPYYQNHQHPQHQHYHSYQPNQIKSNQISLYYLKLRN